MHLKMITNIILKKIEVRGYRERFDRPPRDSGDLSWWTWEYLQSAWPLHYQAWSPTQVPAELEVPNFMGPNDVPMPPPCCWRRVRLT